MNILANQEALTTRVQGNESMLNSLKDGVTVLATQITNAAKKMPANPSKNISNKHPKLKVNTHSHLSAHGY